MSSENIGYHTRSVEDDRKVVGGSFGGDFSMDTVDRLMQMFHVVIRPRGTPQIVDREGRQVRLYVSVDAGKTEKGKAALVEWRAKRAAEAEREEEEELAEQREAELEEAMRGLSHEEILRRLSQPTDTGREDL